MYFDTNLATFGENLLYPYVDGEVMWEKQNIDAGMRREEQNCLLKPVGDNCIKKEKCKTLYRRCKIYVCGGKEAIKKLGKCKFKRWYGAWFHLGVLKVPTRIYIKT